MSVLLLNASYEPLNIISVERALNLIFDDRAEAVDLSDKEYRSPSVSVKVPEVIRLKYYVKVPFRIFRPLTNRHVLKRDGHICAYCGGKATTVDHVIPKARGGQHDWNNVVAACGPCNQEKSDILLEELGWSMRHTPHIPMFKFDAVKESWGKWLQ